MTDTNPGSAPRLLSTTPTFVRRPNQARDSSTRAGRLPIMSLPKDSGVPSFKEALKNDREQFDDCTPCRIVGESTQCCSPACPRANALCRERSVHRPRRIHVPVRTLAIEGTGSRHKAEQEHVWHGKSEGCYYGHGNRAGWRRSVQMVQLDMDRRGRARGSHASIRGVQLELRQYNARVYIL